MTDTLTALRNAAKALLAHMGGAYNWSKEDEQVLSEINDAVLSLSEPFDPAKHLSGWVKDGTRREVWAIRTVTTNGEVYFRLTFGSITGWTLEELDHDTWYIRFTGPLPTLHFFALLCGALNIK